MGIDWEEILGAEGTDILSAWEERVAEAEEFDRKLEEERHRKNTRKIAIQKTQNYEKNDFQIIQRKNKEKNFENFSRIHSLICKKTKEDEYIVILTEEVKFLALSILLQHSSITNEKMEKIEKIIMKNPNEIMEDEKKDIYLYINNNLDGTQQNIYMNILTKLCFHFFAKFKKMYFNREQAEQNYHNILYKFNPVFEIGNKDIIFRTSGSNTFTVNNKKKDEMQDRTLIIFAKCYKPSPFKIDIEKNKVIRFRGFADKENLKTAYSRGEYVQQAQKNILKMDILKSYLF